MRRPHTAAGKGANSVSVALSASANEREVFAGVIQAEIGVQRVGRIPQVLLGGKDHAISIRGND
jgi:hypothetical protein